MGLDLDQLRTLVALSDTGSVSGAARIVHKTPSAVSTHLSKLATAVGRPLLQRDGRGVVLTPDGVEVARYARRIVGLEQEVLSRFDASAFAGTLRIGLPDDYIPALMAPLFEGLRAVAPRAKLDVQCAPSAELRPILAEAGLDIVILSAESGSDAGTLLRRERVVWAKASHLDLSSATAVPLALFPPGCIIRAAALRHLTAQETPYEIACVSRSMQAVQAAISSGLAIAPVAESCVPEGSEIAETGESGLPHGPLPELATIDIVLAAAPTIDPGMAHVLGERVRARISG